MIKIGITGHRNLDERFISEYKKLVAKKLNELKQKHREMLILSPLADGADRLVVYEAMKLDIKYIAILPMKKELYKDDFDITSKLEFEKLLNNAEHIITIRHKKIFLRDEQYELAGKYTSNNSDILFALWDGKQNGFKGGTGEIVKYHTKNKKDLWHLKVLRNPI